MMIAWKWRLETKDDEHEGRWRRGEGWDRPPELSGEIELVREGGPAKGIMKGGLERRGWGATRGKIVKEAMGCQDGIFIVRTAHGYPETRTQPTVGTPEQNTIAGGKEGIGELMIFPAASGCIGTGPDDRISLDHMTETLIHRRSSALGVTSVSGLQL